MNQYLNTTARNVAGEVDSVHMTILDDQHTEAARLVMAFDVVEDTVTFRVTSGSKTVRITVPVRVAEPFLLAAAQAVSDELDARAEMEIEADEFRNYTQENRV
jgi:hypothetical protein